MLWESKRHEENLQFHQQRMKSLQDELNEACHEKGQADGKLMELDSLVSQLLMVNESLVAQLSGKPLNLSIRSSSAVKKPASKKTTIIVPRAASIGTIASDANRTEKFANRRTSQMIPVQLQDVEQLRNMHKIYADMARTIKKSYSRKSSSSSSDIGGSASSSTGSSKKKINTRLSKKKADLIEQFNEEAHNALYQQQQHHDSVHNISSNNNHHQRNGASSSNSSSMEIRLPKPSVSFDYDDFNTSMNSRNSDQHNNNTSMNDSGIQYNRDYYDNSRSSHNSSFNLPRRSSGGDNSSSNILRSSSSNNLDISSSSIAAAAASSINSTAYHSNNNSSSQQQQQRKDRSELDSVISSLENEFNELNAQYRKLLSNVQSAPSSSVDYISNSTPPSNESIQAQAEEIVSVIQKLHQKGEQLRTLRNSP